MIATLAQLNIVPKIVWANKPLQMWKCGHGNVAMRNF